MPVAAIPHGLNQFQELLLNKSGKQYLGAVWRNEPLPNSDMGGQDMPLSYNVMPLPQQSTDTPGYILKNFTYYETVQFEGDDDVALPATAPNRGNTTLQVPTAVFYNQQVYFAQGPGKGGIVHVENGAWLNLVTGEKLLGPYPPPPGSEIHLNDPNTQPKDITVAKQMSVPHGNSILALGSYTGVQQGAPSVPNAPSVLPTPAGSHGQADGINTSKYMEQLDGDGDYENPEPDLTANTNQPIQMAIEILGPNAYINWNVSTGNQGSTMNIPFEQSAANVTDYTASYWLLSTDGGSTFNHLAYTQNISMQFTINGLHYNFPHVTTNVVTKMA